VEEARAILKLIEANRSFPLVVPGVAYEPYTKVRYGIAYHMKPYTKLNLALLAPDDIRN